MQQILVHVSSVYAITKDIGANVIEEKLYPPPAEIEQVYNFAKNNNTNKHKTKEFLGKFYLHDKTINLIFK